ncbi:hypothetical protein E2C01_070207 [Portunus trituberculatus]|uniref:Uncharacterized protein n=1 Tax=Portunus trituberculatus TaxID=210409 RepID=A0A5B7HTK2_PORTR|nr:hypothetical protein [Portunus trituberculatus]
MLQSTLYITISARAYCTSLICAQHAS